MTSDSATQGGQGIERGKLEAARAAGAHDEFIAFVAEYPESGAADTLETAIALDALDDFQGVAGSFVGRLWENGVESCGNPDTTNSDRIMELFDKERWPKWLRQMHEETDTNSKSDGDDR